MEERRYTTEKNDLMRIDKFLSEKLPDLSRSSLEDHISVTIPELKAPDILPEQIPLDILYED